MIEKINVYDSDLDTDHLKKIILKMNQKLLKSIHQQHGIIVNYLMEQLDLDSKFNFKVMSL